MKWLPGERFPALISTGLLLFFAGFLNAEQPAPPSDELSYQIPVVVVKYFPVDENGNIDIKKSGDWGYSLNFTRYKVERITREIVKVLEEGSRFRAYSNPGATPSLKYKILETFEYLEPLPTFTNPKYKDPMTDYNAIIKRINIEDWVENKGVKEVWIWGYHGGVVHLWESNMAGPHGDVSNSDRDTSDLPILSKSYTVYHYNYQRGLMQTIENHIHQIEALLNHVDGRDETAPKDWPELLFWGKFVGSDSTHKIVGDPRCGWAHYAPNSEKDYDWTNKRYVYSDIEDWKPDGTGLRHPMNCERWDCNGLGWFIMWMQSLAGKDNALSYNGKPLRNWWIFVGDWDSAKANKMTLSKE